MTAWLRFARCSAAALALGGCATSPGSDSWGESAAFYWQATRGHLDVLNAARPVDELLADAAVPDALKKRLAAAKSIRAYASTQLGLPNNAGYTRYSHVPRSGVVYNVVAAPPYSLQAKTWCFMVAGCVGYRGYYSEREAQSLATSLKAQGYETTVYPVPAYSTLGKLAWLGDYGADPLLSTFIQYPDAELARLIFHELAHQVLYVPDDTVFNESFATAVERLGGRQWLAAHGTPAQAEAFALRDQRAAEWRALLAQTRQELQAAYDPSKTDNLDQNPQGVARNWDFFAMNSGVTKAKQAAMQRLQERYAALKTSWGGWSGYDAALARTNNATLAASGAYDELVPQFEAVFAREGGNWPRFYDAVKPLVPLEKTQRRQALKTLAGDR